MPTSWFELPQAAATVASDATTATDMTVPRRADRLQCLAADEHGLRRKVVLVLHELQVLDTAHLSNLGDAAGFNRSLKTFLLPPA